MILVMSYVTWKCITLGFQSGPLIPYIVPGDTTSVACSVSGIGSDAILYKATMTASELLDFNTSFPTAIPVNTVEDLYASFVGGIPVLTVAPARATISMGYLDVNPLPVPLTMVTAVWVPPDVTAVRVRMNNNDQTGVVGTAPDATGVGLAIGASDGAYGYSGSPNVINDGTVGGGITVPGNNNPDYVTDWLPAMRGADGKMLVVFSIPSGNWIKTNGAAAVLYNGKRSQTVAQVSPLPTLIDSASTAFTVRVEFQRTAAPRFIFIGDSITLGYALPGLPGLETSYGYLLGPNKGWAVDICGIPGATNSDWNDPMRPFSTGMLFNGAIGVSDLSINDLPTLTGATDALKRDDFLARVALRSSQMKAAGCKKFVQFTLAQNAAYVAQDSIRVLINAALVSGVGVTGVDAVVDVATLIASLPSPLLPDGTHWTEDTHIAVSNLCGAVLQTVL
jgi:hypothetical protein